MAKKPTKEKSKAKSKTASEKVKSSDVMKMPAVSVVKSIASSITATLKKKGILSDDLRVEIAEAKSQKGIHPGALKRVERLLYKAKNTDRGIAAVATELAHFDYYRDVLGLDELLKKQGQMFTRPEAGEHDEPEQAGGEPEPIGKAALRVVDNAAAGRDVKETAGSAQG